MNKNATDVPPLGYNTWSSYLFNIDEATLMAELDVFIQRLKPAGYSYFVIDAGWTINHYGWETTPSDPRLPSWPATLDDYGLPVPSVRKFPNGLAPLVERCHANGIKLGVHYMRGVPRAAVTRDLTVKGTSHRMRDFAEWENDCNWGPGNVGVDMSKPGAQAFLDSQMARFAAMGIDFVKMDDLAEHPKEIEGYGRAIARCGRPMLLSISPGNAPWKGQLDVYRQWGDMLRITPDIWDVPADLNVAFERWELWEECGSPACWLDLDMIPFGRLKIGDVQEHVCQLTRIQKETFMAQRALAASPLFFGGALQFTPDEDFALVTDPDMLACNRNGVTARRIFGDRRIDIRRAPHRNDRAKGWIGVFNRKESASFRFALTPENLGFPAGTPAASLRLFDIWHKRYLVPDGDVFCFEMPFWGCSFLRIDAGA